MICSLANRFWDIIRWKSFSLLISAYIYIYIYVMCITTKHATPMWEKSGRRSLVYKNIVVKYMPPRQTTFPLSLPCPPESPGHKPTRLIIHPHRNSWYLFRLKYPQRKSFISAYYIYIYIVRLKIIVKLKIFLIWQKKKKKLI